MDLIDLTLRDVPTKRLIEEAQRRAPVCPKGCRVPMLVSPTWFVCPVCRFTVDFE